MEDRKLAISTDPLNSGVSKDNTGDLEGGFSFEIKAFGELSATDKDVTNAVTSATRAVPFEEQYGDRSRHLVDAELKLEVDAVEFSRKRYMALVEKRDLVDLTPGVQMVKRGFEAVRGRIQAWMDADISKGGRGVGVVKFIQQFDADELAIHALRACVGACVDGGVRDVTLIDRMMTAIEDTDLESRLKEADPLMHQRYVTLSKRRKNPNVKSAFLRKQGEYTGVFDASSTYSWTHTERMVVGLELLMIVIEETGMVQRNTLIKQMGARTVTLSYVLPTQGTVEWVRQAHETLSVLHPVTFPMVVRPFPWAGEVGGGYLTQKGAFKKSFTKKSFKQTKTARSKGSADAYAAINALQDTRWRINTRVLANAVEPAHEKFDMPTRHPFMDRERETWTKEEVNKFVEWKKACVAINQKIAADCAIHLSFMTQRDIAAKMSRYEVIYYPHNLDFRGRAYPLPGFVTPQGNDFSKALLEFADAKPLGEFGHLWLAVHGANTYGEVDKKSFEVRKAWVADHAVEILMDARDPLRPNAFWRDADSPYQFLAFCFEFADLTQWVNDGNDVAMFQSRLAVGMDGSCNGLQHYSAILRDPVGGAAVNLKASDTPSDIYSLVAKEVSRSIELDLMDEEKAPFAKFWLAKGITRKMTKRNTMTLPYGVTRRGMQDQLWAEIGGTQDVMKYIGDSGLGAKKIFNYLAMKNWDGTGTVVRAAREAMDFLRDCAKVCNKAEVSPKWTLKDGMSVQQEYAKEERLDLYLRGAVVRMTVAVSKEERNTRKQSTGIAPNFVHSVDACHMRMTINALKAEGVDAFAMIHDSYGTHAGNIETLQRVTREQFVALHEENLLEKFRAEIISLLPEEFHKDVPAVPASGTLNLKAVLTSPYFFA
jgi:DNA-directed RNA polymerase